MFAATASPVFPGLVADAVSRRSLPLICTEERQADLIRAGGRRPARPVTAPGLGLVTCSLGGGQFCELPIPAGQDRVQDVRGAAFLPIMHRPAVRGYLRMTVGGQVPWRGLGNGYPPSFPPTVALAHESGNEDTASLLAKVVDVIDPVTGTVRLKTKVVDADEMALDTRSTKTVRVST